MALEIERKFIVSSDGWRQTADDGQRFRQAYLASSELNSVRVRIIGETQAVLTVKSGYRGITRDEFDYEVPMADALTMLSLCSDSVIDKTRFRVSYAGLVWEIDVYAGDNSGLIVAEVEIDCETQQVDLPPWIGREVTGELRYQNSQLSIVPYCAWDEVYA